jgi:mannose-6-phosphate isomerase-like protein (cupin superfamily)
MEPGATTLAREHLVLEGDLVDSDGTAFRKGDFVSCETGTRHRSWSEGSCLLAVFEWQRP